MEKRIVFATANEGKMIEIREILADLGVAIYSMKEVGIEMDIIEDGNTFEDNALIKARAVAELLPDDIILADDSGLEIDFLDGEPGVHTARFGGVNTSYKEKMQLLLDKLQGVPKEKRGARFVCVIAAIFPDRSEELTRDTIEGRIAFEVIGEYGFGYDPIFYLPEFACTTAQLKPEKKHELSHRGKALRGMRKILEKRAKIA